MSREQAKCTFNIFGLGATVTPARVAFQPYNTSHLYQDSATLGKQSHGISCSCSQYHLHADIQHKWNSEQGKFLWNPILSNCPSSELAKLGPDKEGRRGTLHGRTLQRADASSNQEGPEN